MLAVKQLQTPRIPFSNLFSFISIDRWLHSRYLSNESIQEKSDELRKESMLALQEFLAQPNIVSFLAPIYEATLSDIYKLLEESKDMTLIKICCDCIALLVRTYV